MSNPLVEVQQFGQSIWYDNIRRGLITTGELHQMVVNDGLLGITSNPAIFKAALVGSADYDPATKTLIKQGVGSAIELYERLAVEDIQWASDVLYPVYEWTEGRDGYVSLEVSPYLANDTAGTIAEARRLRQAVGRDNVLIKIPATPAGVPAIEQAISEGISINVTLLFAVEAYEAVAKAYMSGLEKFAAAGGNPRNVASVASFFVSRIDTLVDEKLDQAAAKMGDAGQKAKILALRGKTAIANARLAYERYLELYASDRWKALAGKGARTQRLLWASTSTKNPAYPKTLYVDELIGNDTVNTIPADTFAAFRESGKVRASLTEDWDNNLVRAREIMSALAAAGISMKEVTDALLADAIKKFSDPFDQLLATLEKKRQELSKAANVK